MRQILISLIAYLSLSTGMADAQRVCPSTETLLDRFIDAPILVIGRFQNPVPPNSALPNGQIELILDDVVVPHA